MSKVLINIEMWHSDKHGFIVTVCRKDKNLVGIHPHVTQSSRKRLLRYIDLREAETMPTEVGWITWIFGI